MNIYYLIQLVLYSLFYNSFFYLVSFNYSFLCNYLHTLSSINFSCSNLCNAHTSPFCLYIHPLLQLLHFLSISISHLFSPAIPSLFLFSCKQFYPWYVSHKIYYFFSYNAWFFTVFFSYSFYNL